MTFNKCTIHAKVYGDVDEPQGGGRTSAMEEVILPFSLRPFLCVCLSNLADKKSILSSSQITIFNLKHFLALLSLSR